MTQTPTMLGETLQKTNLHVQMQTSENLWRHLKDIPRCFILLAVYFGFEWQKSPYFLDLQNILDSASQQKSHPQTRGSRCLGPPGWGTVPSNDRKCGKGRGFLAKRDLAVSKCCFQVLNYKLLLLYYTCLLYLYIRIIVNMMRTKANRTVACVFVVTMVQHISNPRAISKK